MNEWRVVISMFSRQKWLGDIWTLYQCSVASLPRWQIVEKEEVSQKRERRGIRFQEVSETSQEMFFGHRARLWIFWVRISGRSSRLSYWVALSKWKPLISFESYPHHWTTILKSVCQFPPMESRNGKLPPIKTLLTSASRSVDLVQSSTPVCKKL